MTNLTQAKNQSKASLIIYYQGFIAVTAILVFFTRLDIYLENHTPIIPLYWLIAFLVLSFPLFISLFKRLDCISTNVLLWSVGYIAISCISIIVQSKLPELQYLEDQYRTIVFLLLMLTIFSYHPLVYKWSKRTILSVTLINICMFIYEFFNSLAFHEIQRAPGRSSGFYDDSNTAGIAIILGMIFTIDMIKPKYRLFYTLLVFLGIAPTFSRGSIAGWVLVVGLLILTKVIPRYQMSLVLLFFIILISILSTQLNNLKYLKNADGTALFKEDTLARVEFLIDPFAQKDDSQASRLHHIEDAWKKFEASPFIGNGLGGGQNSSITSEAGKAQRSHNTYLDLMVEYGFLGALIFPLLLLSCVCQAQGILQKQAIAFAIFMLMQGFFSHTLMSEFCSLIAYAIMANLTKHSHLKSLQLSTHRLNLFS